VSGPSVAVAAPWFPSPRRTLRARTAAAPGARRHSSRQSQASAEWTPHGGPGGDASPVGGGRRYEGSRGWSAAPSRGPSRDAGSRRCAMRFSVRWGDMSAAARHVQSRQQDGQSPVATGAGSGPTPARHCRNAVDSYRSRSGRGGEASAASPPPPVRRECRSRARLPQKRTPSASPLPRRSRLPTRLVGVHAPLSRVPKV
jgi:hypothetical protein